MPSENKDQMIINLRIIDSRLSLVLIFTHPAEVKL